MYICLCNGVTESQLRDAAGRGMTDIREVCEHLGVASNCGQCLNEAWQVINHASGKVMIDTVQLG